MSMGFPNLSRAHETSGGSLEKEAGVLEHIGKSLNCPFQEDVPLGTLRVESS